MPPKTRAKARAEAASGSVLGSLAIFVAVLTAVSAVGVGALLKAPVATAPIEQTAPFVTLVDGRNVSYELRGDPRATNTILYLHRSASSRLEAGIFDEAVLQKNNARVVAIDRPGYGQSSPHPARNLTTFADDVEQVAAALRLHRLLVVGTSVGATYALALAALLPDRVQAALLISPSGSTLELNAEELAELKADVLFPGSKYPVHGLFRKVAQHPAGAAILKAFAQAPLAGRLMHAHSLAPILRNVTAKIDLADVQCITATQPQVLAAYTEGLAQRSAGAWMEDLTTVLQPLPFNVSEAIPAALQQQHRRDFTKVILATLQVFLKAKISIVASAQDSTVPTVFAKNLKRRLPFASFRTLDVAGHIGFFACQPAWQRQVLQDLVVRSCADNPTATGCTEWAASGECSANVGFMLENCKKSCGACHYTDADIAKIVATPCEDYNESCTGWAAGGECANNPRFMFGDSTGEVGNCRKACAACHTLV